MECVADQIRFKGNLGLGICAVPNGCDADSGEELGKCNTYKQISQIILLQSTLSNYTMIVGDKVSHT